MKYCITWKGQGRDAQDTTGSSWLWRTELWVGAAFAGPLGLGPPRTLSYPGGFSPPSPPVLEKKPPIEQNHRFSIVFSILLKIDGFSISFSILLWVDTGSLLYLQ